MKEIIGHPDFLYLGDSKASTYQNRAKINEEGVIYCFPLAMIQPRPKSLSDWVKNPVTETIKFYFISKARSHLLIPKARCQRHATRPHLPITKSSIKPCHKI